MSAAFELLALFVGPVAFVASTGLLFSSRFRQNYLFVGLAALFAIGSTWLTVEEYWYRIFGRTVPAVMTEHASEAGDRQKLVLAEMAQDTTLRRIEAAYGPASRESSSGRSMYGEYSGEGHYLYLIRNASAGSGEKLIGVALRITDPPASERFPIPFMKLVDFDDRAKTLVHRTTLSRLPVSWLGARCDQISVANGPDARFGFFSTSKCYFGRPGSYKDFYFGFETESIVSDCEKWESTQWVAQRKLAAASCPAFRKLTPTFALITIVDMDERLAASIAFRLQGWRYTGSAPSFPAVD